MSEWWFLTKQIRQSSQWINYEIPQETLDTLPWGKKYKGQTQKWFVFRFEGEDNEINISTKNPEFSEWKWANYNSLLDNIVPFKKNTYKKIIEEFIEIFWIFKFKLNLLFKIFIY